MNKKEERIDWLVAELAAIKRGIDRIDARYAQGFSLRMSEDSARYLDFKLAVEDRWQLLTAKARYTAEYLRILEDEKAIAWVL